MLKRSLGPLKLSTSSSCVLLFDCLGATHQCCDHQYELVRSTATLHKQHPVCMKKPAARRHVGNQFMKMTPAVSLRRLLDATAHYEEVIRESGAKSSSASAVLRSIAREVEREGVFGGREMNDEEALCVLSFLAFVIVKSSC